MKFVRKQSWRLDFSSEKRRQILTAKWNGTSSWDQKMKTAKWNSQYFMGNHRKDVYIHVHAYTKEKFIYIHGWPWYLSQNWNISITSKKQEIKKDQICDWNSNNGRNILLRAYTEFVLSRWLSKIRMKNKHTRTHWQNYQKQLVVHGILNTNASACADKLWSNENDVHNNFSKTKLVWARACVCVCRQHHCQSSTKRKYEK